VNHRWPLVSMILIACALVVQASSAAMADRPCRADIQKFCADVKPGGGRVAACLKKHDAELSPACKARGQEVRERVREAHEACQHDVAKFCNGVKPGEGRIHACLGSHDKDLSGACKAAMKPVR
jgi:hypothetical protein